jgi:hypothetical protein
MIEYEGYFGRKYRIVGWLGNCLKTETDSHTFILTRANTIMLLKELGLQEHEIPGGPQSKWSGWDACYAM